MPLVFVVLIIIVVFLNAKDSIGKSNRRSSIYQKNMRKTNARLEQRIMDDYMKHGYSADDAFKKSYEDMISKGYEPCIPRSAYGENSSYCKGKYGFNPEYYDSFLVRSRRSDIEEEWKRIRCYSGKTFESEKDIEKEVYKNFPSTVSAYLYDLERRGGRLKAVPIGTYIIYPGLGTCEIVAHNWVSEGASVGTYTLKVLKTGKYVRHVKIGDKKIQLQGE